MAPIKHILSALTDRVTGRASFQVYFACIIFIIWQASAFANVVFTYSGTMTTDIPTPVTVPISGELIETNWAYLHGATASYNCSFDCTPLVDNGIISLYLDFFGFVYDFIADRFPDNLAPGSYGYIEAGPYGAYADAGNYQWSFEMGLGRIVQDECCFTGVFSGEWTLESVPEPSSLLLLLTGIVAIFVCTLFFRPLHSRIPILRVGRSILRALAAPL